MKNQFWCLITSGSNWLVVPLLLVFVQSFAQDNTVRYFYSLDSNVPLSYLRVVPSDAKQAFFTDLKGKLEIANSKLPQVTSFNISGYGINDTLISIQDFLSAQTIFLETKDFVLPEVSIGSTQLHELKIGDSKAGLWEVKGPIKLLGGEEGEFSRDAIRVKISSRNQHYLDEIKFYVSKSLVQSVYVSVRILFPSPAKKIVPGRKNPVSGFKELLQENKIVNVTKSGWQEVRFAESVQIPVGVSDLFIVFDLLETVPKSNFAIAEQKTSKKIDFGFYLTGGSIGVDNLYPIHPAVEITFLKAK